MKALSSIALLLLTARSALATGSLLARSPYGTGGGSGYGGSGYGGAGSGSSSTSTTVPTTANSAGQRGDSKCGTNMCVEALVNGSTVQYTLTAQRSNVGWMGIGYGSQMTGVPMVIMWANADGSITLSQRQASGYIEPSVTSSPPRVATLQSSLSATSGSNPKYVYTIPANSDTTQSIIYAFGSTAPSSSAPNARLLQHISQGTLTLDLTKTVGGASSTPTGNTGSTSVPFTDRQRMIVAHAVIASLGFVLFLPIGALLPRYLRTFVAGPTWFKSHWIFQFVVAGLSIIIGVSLGFAVVGQGSGIHANTTHHRLGIALFALYFIQIGVGAVIHWVKPKGPRRRPPQNYFHAILGILIIALSLYQVRTGYAVEWLRVAGRGPAPNGVNIVWYIWVVALPVLYFAGMALLPKQYAQERKARHAAGGSH